MVEGKDSEAEEAFSLSSKITRKTLRFRRQESILEKIEEAKKASRVCRDFSAGLSESHRRQSESVVAVAAALEKPWAPPDVDGGIPPTAPGVSCSLETVLQKTQQRILRQLGDLEKFSATERIDHQVLDSSGVWTTPAISRFQLLDLRSPQQDSALLLRGRPKG